MTTTLRCSICGEATGRVEDAVAHHVGETTCRRCNRTRTAVQASNPSARAPTSTAA